jgi:hypothetical protein
VSQNGLFTRTEFVTTQAKRENWLEDLRVIRTSLLIETLLDLCTHRPESRQIIRLLHQRRRHGGVDLHRGQPLCAPPGFWIMGHRHACHDRIHHMAVPEDMGRDPPLGELLSARNLLDPGLFCQAVYDSGAPSWCSGVRAMAGEEPLLTRPDWTACKVPCLTRVTQLYRSDS